MYFIYDNGYHGSQIGLVGSDGTSEGATQTGVPLTGKYLMSTFIYMYRCSLLGGVLIPSAPGPGHLTPLLTRSGDLGTASEC